MQFTSVVLFASAALAATSYETATKSETITSCGPEVTDCPAREHGNSTITTASDNAANGAYGNYYAAGAAALAAGALLM
ncbi:hypothetical protein DAPK24_012730 [Pichia kluyveri]|uniref:Uncharacterized protein n=1 Tax=Pichia kluyveri TaxID=36015 RepID=A0AAV5R144_PICKL|nr:hypothetical protein DAPK24_012730 [Pichia kluyveri]